MQLLIGIGRRATITTVCVEGIWRIFEDRVPIVIYTDHSFLSPAKFKRCVLSDMKIKGTTVSPRLSVALTSISTLLSSSISAYLCLPPAVRTVHFSIEAFRWRIAVKATLRGINAMFGVGWQPYLPSHAFDDVSTPVFDRPLVIVIASHILESVSFPLPESLLIWDASHKLLHAIPVFEAWETHRGVLFLHHVVIVRLHTPLLHLTLDILVFFTRRKPVVGIVL